MRKLKQSQIARELSISKSYLSMILSGQRKASPELLEKLQVIPGVHKLVNFPLQSVLPKQGVVGSSPITRSIDRKFKGMTVVRGIEYMSLVGCVHMGGESFVEKYGQRVIDKLASLGKDIVYFHNEGFALVHVKAKEHGITVPFGYMHLFEHLCNYLRDHQSSISKLGKKVAYQANCATRYVPEQDAFLDEIFEFIGVKRPPRLYERLNAVCCTAPIINTNRELAVGIQEKNVKDAIECGADALITSCPYCDRVLRRPTSQLSLPKIFITDLCRIALGEKPWPA